MDDDPISLISSDFNPTEPGFQDADLVLLTTDAVFFYAHTSTLLQESSNRFGNLIHEKSTGHDLVHSEGAGTHIAESPLLKIAICDYSSDVLELVLSAVYKRTSAEILAPSITTLQKSFTALVSLGYCPKDMLTPGSELFTRSLETAEIDPLPVYALAAQHSLEPLAVAVSRLIPAHSLDAVSDELALQMGAIYLKRLFRTFRATPRYYSALMTACYSTGFIVLHMGRTKALKLSIKLPLRLHKIGTPPGIRCNEKVQRSVQYVWALVSGYGVVHGDLGGLDDALFSFIEHLDCELCGKFLKDRVKRTVCDLDLMSDSI
ncbi:hypothetical protein FRC12_008973 [Ceratobasidium sp. 428]|nr:hypothetical protein FRC12_008973 [Ceratobasidium sp. 428]